MKVRQGPPASRPERLQWLDEQLASLAKGCPHTRTNPADCPLCELRRLKPAAISRWLDGLRTEDKEYLMLYHQCCLVIRWESERAARRGRARKNAGHCGTLRGTKTRSGEKPSGS